MKEVTVLYHADADGFASAFCNLAEARRPS